MQRRGRGRRSASQRLRRAPSVGAGAEPSDRISAWRGHPFQLAGQRAAGIHRPSGPRPDGLYDIGDDSGPAPSAVSSGAPPRTCAPAARQPSPPTMCLLTRTCLSGHPPRLRADLSPSGSAPRRSSVRLRGGTWPPCVLRASGPRTPSDDASKPSAPPPPRPRTRFWPPNTPERPRGGTPRCAWRERSLARTP